MHTHPHAHPPADAPAILCRDVTYTYPGGSGPAVESISLRVDAGMRLGVLGPNGGGKSTLLKLMLGLLTPDRGDIRIFGSSPREARRARLIGYVPQRSDAERHFPLSVRQVVRMSASLRNPPWRGLSREQADASQEAMRVVAIEEIADRHAGSLSGGQFQRVLIARALASRPRLLFLDEPTVGIDPAGQQQFAQLLRRLRESFAITIVVVSHDLRTVAAGCDRVACLSRTLHSHVSPEGLTPRVLAEVFRHDVAAIFGDIHVDAHNAAACPDPSHHHPH